MFTNITTLNLDYFRFTVFLDWKDSQNHKTMLKKKFEIPFAQAGQD